MTQATKMSERTVEVSNNRIKMRIKVGGVGPPLVYFHPSAGLLWDPFLARLAEHYTIYAPEFPGTSAGDPYAIHQIDAVWDAVLAYEETIRALNIGQPIAVGQSFGGMLAAEIAASYPSIFSKLVVLDPIGLWRDDAPILPRWIDGPPSALPELLFLNPDADAPQAMLRMPEDPDRLASAQAALVWTLGCTGKLSWPIPDRGLDKRIHRITAQTLIVWGEDDQLAPVVYADEWRKRITGSQVEIVPKCGHIPQVEQMESTYALVTRFLSSAAI